MRIPIINADQNVHTGSTGPTASPESFGPSFSGLEQGIEGLGQGAGHLARTQARLDRFKSGLDDSRWVGEATEQYKAHLNEWMASPDNNGKESYSTDFQKYATENLDPYVADAPSQRAADAFKLHMGEFIGRKYDEALQTSERTKLTNTVLSIDQQAQNALKAYNSSKQTPGADYLKDLSASYDNISKQIDTQFGANAPVTAAKLKEGLAINIALGTMTDDPSYAKKLAMAAPMDEEKRRTLLNHIATAERAISVADRDNFDRTRKDAMAQLQSGKTPDKIPLETYQKYYPGEHAIVQKRTDDEIFDSYSEANKSLDKISSWNLSSQMGELNQRYSGIKTEHDKNVYSIMADRMKQSLELQIKNRVAWLQQYNPEVKAAAERAQNSTSATRTQALGELNDAVLKYQGDAPPDASVDEAKKYLGIPENDRHLMRMDEAEQMAYKINRSSPGEVIDQINQVMARYPDQRHQYTAFNDLVTMPERGKGIKQEYQLAWQNRGHWWVDTYLGAIGNEKPIVQLTEEKRKEFDKTLDANPTWRSFQTAMIGDNFQRAKEIDGYRNGITAYAHALITQGKSPAQAINSSVDMLISSTLGFANVNGHPLTISREKGNHLPPRSDEEVADIGRRLSVALKFIDPRQVDTTNFRGLKPLEPESRVEYQQALRDSITARAFFQTGNDGQSANLYYSDDNGSIFEIRDKAGQPFRIHFDQLPAFYGTADPVKPRPNTRAAIVGYPELSSNAYSFQKGIDGKMHVEPQKVQPEKNYPLAETIKRNLIDANVMKTNWPSTFPWEKK